MNVALRRAMSLEEFLDWEERQPIRYEFDGHQAYAMAGGSLPHSTIKINLTGNLFNRLRGKRCRLFDSDAKVEVAGHIRYPDAAVSCSAQTDPVRARRGIIDEPVVVFEVLSDATSLRDRTEKNAEYQATPSIQRYVMIEQERIAATVFERQGDDWVGHLLIGEQAIVSLPEIDVEPIRLGDLYENVEIPEADPDAP